MASRRIALPIALAATAAVCIRLGFWQLDRAEEEERTALATAERATQPPVRLTGPLPPEEALTYRRAVVHGRFEPEGHILLDNRSQDGVLGVHLVVPLRIAGSRVRLLVNRGWLARDAAQPVSAPAADGEVTGLLIRPSVPPLKLGEDARQAERWGIRWPYLDLALFERQHGYPVAPLVLVEDQRLAAEMLAAGVAGQSRFGMHIGYALQWFLFSAIALFLAARQLSRPREQT